MKVLIEKVLKTAKVKKYKIKGKMLETEDIDGIHYTCHLNLLAELCLEYAWERGFEIEIFKSRVDSLWTASYSEYEKITNRDGDVDWEIVSYRPCTIFEHSDYCTCVFGALKELNIWELK